MDTDRGGASGSTIVRDMLARRGWEALALLAVVIFFLPAFLHWSAWGWGDWGYFHFLDAVARRTVFDFGELPEWNPYQCGGNVLAANTQAHVWSPWFVFPLIFGPAGGAKVAMALHGLIGAAGMLLLLGAMGIRGAGRFLGATLFACSAFFGQQISGGHVWAWPFFYVPFVVHFLLRGCYELRWAALAGAVMGLMALEGGVYPVPYTGLLAAAVCLAMTLGWTPLEGRPPARRWMPGAALLVCVVAMALIGAAKLLPSLAHMAANPRTVTDYDRIGPGTLLDTFVWRNREWGWDRDSHFHYRWWGEYSCYVGWATLALAAGAVVLRFRRVRVPLVLLGIALALTLGHLGPGTPWDVLHRLPVFENLRVPSRFSVFSVLVLAFLAAVAVSEGEKWLRERLRGSRAAWLGAALPAVVALGIAADTAVFNAAPIPAKFNEPAPAPDEPPAPMVQSRGSYKRMYDHLARNRGSLACQEINPIPRSPRVRVQDAEYGLLPAGAGTVRLIDWSPNEINLEVAAAEPARLWVNQNYHAGWSSSVGRAEPLENQLTVLVPAGEHRVRLVYRAPGLRAGLGLTGLGAALIGAWFVLDRRWRRGTFSVFGFRFSAPESGGCPPDPNRTLQGAAEPAGPARPRAEARGSDGQADSRVTTHDSRPAAFSRRWWLKVFAPNAAFAVLALGVPAVSLLVAETSDAELVDDVAGAIRPRFRDGDVLQFNPSWAGAGQRPFAGLAQDGPDARAELDDGGWRRMWYVYCRRDGIERKLRDVLERTALVERFELGHYTVYLLEPPGAADTEYLPDRIGEARARVIPREGTARACERRGGGPPLVCGPQPYQEVRASTEKIGGQLRRCVWIHPLPDGAETEVTFPGFLGPIPPEPGTVTPLPAAPDGSSPSASPRPPTASPPSFTFRYGLTDGAAAVKNGGPVSLRLSAGAVPLASIEVPNEQGWQDLDVEVPAGAPADLVIRVSSANPGARHLCVGASFVRVAGR
ncbi:MAG: hypothetical protein HY905_00595 [Deltaproteobacteria bacterium]|nr:hypothetical protein [Deltaproteobacteria bacterium]